MTAVAAAATMRNGETMDMQVRGYGYWEPRRDVADFRGRTYNVVIIEVSTGDYCAMSADFQDMMGVGVSRQDALANLRELVELRVMDGGGGVFLATSPNAYQIDRCESIWYNTYSAQYSFHPQITIEKIECAELTLFAGGN